MLKIEIFDKPESDKTPTLILNTRVSSSGAFEVFACDESGAPLLNGRVWILRTTGQQQQPFHIRADLGLDLDEKGKIRDA